MNIGRRQTSPQKLAAVEAETQPLRGPLRAGPALMGKNLTSPRTEVIHAVHNKKDSAKHSS